MKIYFEMRQKCSGAKPLISFCLLVILTQPVTARAADWTRPEISATQHSDHSEEISMQAPKEYPVTVELTLDSCVGCASETQMTQKVFIGKGEKVVVSKIQPAGSEAIAEHHSYRFVPGKELTEAPPDLVMQLPFPPGQSVMINQGYHGKFSHRGPNEFGMDFGLPTGSAIHAAQGGTVIFVEQNYAEGGDEARFVGKDNRVIVMHGDFTLGFYMHLRKDGAAVTVGQTVAAGDLLGYSGQTGFARKPHLHFMTAYFSDMKKTIVSVPTKFKTSLGDQDLIEGHAYDSVNR